MFSRRHRSASTSRQNVNPSASAQSAAAQAFLASSKSNADLSASAAATALRTMSPPPVSVAAIQTKRMRQRQASTSPRRGEERTLLRRSSSGSMTERTFRSPSPNRPASSMGLSTPQPVPPVPPVPQNYNNTSQRRPASMEPTSRMKPSPAAKRAARISSVDRTNQSKQTDVTDPDELERSGSRSSINFSYPTGIRATSPPESPIISQPGNSILKSSLRSSDNDIVQELAEAAARPVRKKKKRVVNGSAEGSFLAQGGIRGKNLGPTVTSPQAGSQTPTEWPVAATSRETSSTRSNVPSESPTAIPEKQPAKAEDKLTTKRAQRASGTLAKQPSIVREDWIGEQETTPPSLGEPGSRREADLSPVGSPSAIQSKKKIAIANTSKLVTDLSDHSTSTAQTKPQVTTALPAPAEAPTQNHLSVDNDQDRPFRQPSISPSRSTRFSKHLASEFTGKPKHEPPPRSVSPAKSALKHSSPSPQTSSPVDAAGVGAWKRASIASSENSDDLSTVSAEGYASRAQRKKAARVSFEANPEVVGVGADVTPGDTPILTSPQHRDSSKRGWAGRSRAEPMESIEAQDDMEEIMKPRPVLPLFGSVRGRRDGSAEHSALAVEDDPPSSSASSMTLNSTGPQPSLSSDHAIAGILNHNFSNSRPASDVAASQQPARQSRLPTGQKVSGEEVEIPSIAILPATPGIGESEPGDEWLVEVPGGFPEIPRSEPKVDPFEPKSVAKEQDTVPENSDVKISAIKEEPTPQDLIATTKIIPTPTVIKTDAETDNDSIYSDAAEDIPEFEVDPYGSIDAAVESPLIENKSGFTTSAPESPSNRSSALRSSQLQNPLAGGSSKGESGGLKSQDAVTKRPNRAREGNQNIIQPVSKREPAIPDSPRRKKKQPSSMLASSRETDVGSNQKSMARSMRGQAEQSANAAPAMRSTMKSRETVATRNQSSPQSDSPKGGLSKKTMQSTARPQADRLRQDSATKTQSLILPKSRRLSNDSDSSSSFKRSSRPKSGGGFTMRTSMRGTAGASSTNRVSSPVAASGRDVRSSSPQNRRPFSPMGQGTMRSTLRERSDFGAPAPTLRNRDQDKRSSMFSKPKSKSKPKSGSANPFSSKMASRFADSDSDGPSSSPRVFRSRFENSSDDEPENKKFRPVRGIPKRADAGDSTDLEDTSDEGERSAAARKTTMRTKPAALNGISTTNKSPEIASVDTTPQSPVAPSLDTKKKKGSIFSRFKRQMSSQNTSLPSPTDLPQSPLPTPALPTPSSPAAEPSRGKLQRRHIPSAPSMPANKRQNTGDSWPFPTSPSSKSDRPKTSDGATGMKQKVKDKLQQPKSPSTTRPPPAKRQETTDTITTTNSNTDNQHFNRHISPLVLPAETSKPTTTTTEPDVMKTPSPSLQESPDLPTPTPISPQQTPTQIPTTITDIPPQTLTALPSPSPSPPLPTEESISNPTADKATAILAAKDGGVPATATATVPTTVPAAGAGAGEGAGAADVSFGKDTATAEGKKKKSRFGRLKKAFGRG